MIVATDLKMAAGAVRAGELVLVRGMSVTDFTPQNFENVLGPVLLPAYQPPHVEAGLLTELKTNDDSHRPYNWHLDQSFASEPPEWSALHCVDPGEPPVPTAFVDTCALVAGLSPGLRATLATLDAEHVADYPSSAFDPSIAAIHPVLLDLDAPGRAVLYIAPATVDRFTDWTPEESRPLLERLYSMFNWPEFVYVHHWQPGDLLVWPSRRYPHRAMPAGSQHVDRHLRRMLGYWT